MAAITLTQARAQLQAWLEADAAVARSQSYSIANRSLSRADAGEITEKIKYWSRMVSDLERAASGRRRTRYVVQE